MTEQAQLTPLEAKRRKQIEAKKVAEVILDKHIPIPVGYRVLVRLPSVEDKFEGGIAKAASTIREEYILSMVGVVTDMGEQAYKDAERFPDGPWCKEGDYVMFRANTGTRFKVGKEEYRLMNDDSIEAVIKDVSKLTRA
tara:strand:+ start:2044 stop:2460 length:417 start_codon:yes stop_codon:yes gene_type:complete